MRILKKIFGYGIIVLGVGIFALTIFYSLMSPSNNRDWVPDNTVLASADFQGEKVTIHNIRNFTYRDIFDYTPDYYDKTFDLSKIRTVDFFNEPFSGVAAHTFLSFGFEGGDYITISVEVRREKGESFNALKGLFDQFELIYVIADENDVLKLRTNYRKGDVYRYPIKISQAKARALFVDMLSRANTLANKPEFYNTLTNNCTTNIVSHVNEIAEPEARIGFSWRYLFPKYSASLAYDLGLINDTGSFEDLQKKYLITKKGQTHPDREEFSQAIREL